MRYKKEAIHLLILGLVILSLTYFVLSDPDDGFYNWHGNWQNSTQGVQGINTTIIVNIDMGFGDGTCECESNANIITNSNGDWSTTTLAANFKWNGNGVSAFCNIRPFAAGSECRTYLQQNDIAYAYPDNPTNLLCNETIVQLEKNQAEFTCLQGQNVWTAEWFNCEDTKERRIVFSDPNQLNSDSDSIWDTEERLWDLDPQDPDTDGDGLDEGEMIYSFVDDCPKQCNDYCEPKTSEYWKQVVCNSTPYIDSVMVEDYLYKINRLSYVFNSEDSLLPTYWFGLYSNWLYNDSNIDLSDNWINFSYDDSSWPSGLAYLGYNEFLISTTLDYGPDPQNKTMTYYFRKHFNMSNVGNLTNVQLNIDYDDGVVVFLNENKIFQSPGTTTDHNDIARYHESSIGDNPMAWIRHTFNTTELGYLQNGENVLAIEVHQTAHSSGVANSSDIVLGAYLVSYENITTQGLVENRSEMCNILNSNVTNEEKLKKELMGSWLNVVSANICYENELNSTSCSIPADTFDELIGYAENKIIDSETTKYLNTSNFLKSINNGTCIGCGQCTAPEFTSVNLGNDNQTIVLGWDYIAKADYYKIYYSHNLTAIRDLDTNNLPSYVYEVSLNENTWTDVNATHNLTRFYRVSAICPDTSEEINSRIAGKQTYELKASSDADKKNNLFALIYNYNYTFSKYLNSFCLEYPNICDTNLGYPVIQAIDRSDAEQQPWKSHPHGYLVGADYQMAEGTGYKILINESYDKTEAGILTELMVVNLVASSDADKKNNLFGTVYLENETFGTFLTKVCNQQPQICDTNLGYPVIQAIDRSDAEQQPWVTHPHGYLVGADYQMKSGEGYKMLVNESIIILLNNTIIQ